MTISAFTHDIVEKRAKHIFFEFVHLHCGILGLIYAIKLTIKKLLNLQKMVRKQKICRFSKVSVLENYWDKLYGQLYSVAQTHGTQEMKKMLTRIVVIPPHIRKWILTLYVYQCRSLYQIAFFQRRLKFPSKVRFDEDEIEELLEFRIKYQYKNHDIQRIPLKKTLQKSQLPSKISYEKFLDRYSLMDEKDLDYRINSFE